MIPGSVTGSKYMATNISNARPATNTTSHFGTGIQNIADPLQPSKIPRRGETCIFKNFELEFYWKVLEAERGTRHDLPSNLANSPLCQQLELAATGHFKSYRAFFQGRECGECPQHRRTDMSIPSAQVELNLQDVWLNIQGA
ncbi:hypothetical protein CIHG_07466 [Coccidioides immitis H538.4]|uniref:Uncharacterized protein n=1 Tax=Coccidioides immitis H538.4 TaxID=396776 RepID=A0A0J8RZW6_COCIT|nr:hypothetical protein CIHG_07466 [Coccidioides immitis H538.4]